jgi:hypothetical protein
MTDAKDDGLIEKEEEENILIDEADVKIVKKKLKPRKVRSRQRHRQRQERD